ncbi:hypothetical protein MTO96_020617 [Rhipicephalus appendiculatus]
MCVLVRSQCACSFLQGARRVEAHKRGSSAQGQSRPIAPGPHVPHGGLSSGRARDGSHENAPLHGTARGQPTLSAAVTKGRVGKAGRSMQFCAHNNESHWTD